MTADRITYCDEPGYRVLDLRPDGVDCIPVLGFSSFTSVRKGPDFHFHPDCMEFCLCLKGNLVFDTPKREYAFLPGLVFVSAPDQPHHLRSNPYGLKVCRVLFRIPKNRGRILGLNAHDSEWITRSLTHLPERLFAATPEVNTAFDRLFDLYDNVSRRSPSRPVKMKAAVLALLISIIDAARQPPRKAARKIDEIAQRIQREPAARYPLRELAAESGLSLSAFSSSFRQSYGLPLHTYLLNCRIDRAKELLLGTRRTILSVGQELRFCSTQHFAKTFRRIVGVNPQEFRNAGRTNKLSPEALHRPVTSR